MPVKFSGATPAQIEQYNALLQKLIDSEALLHKREALHVYNRERIESAQLSTFSYSWAYYLGNTLNVYADDVMYEQFLKDFPLFQTYVPENVFTYPANGTNIPVPLSVPTSGWNIPNNLRQIFGIKLAVSFGNGLEQDGQCPPFTVSGSAPNQVLNINDCAIRRAQYQRIRLSPGQPTYNGYNNYGVDQATGTVTSEQFRTWFNAMNETLLKQEQDRHKIVVDEFKVLENYLLNQQSNFSAQQSLISATNAVTALQGTVNDILKDPVKIGGFLLLLFAFFALMIFLFKK